MTICFTHFSEFRTSLHKDDVTQLSSGNTHEGKMGEQHPHHQPADGLEGFRFTILHLPF